jgi:RNA polymerase sigma factor (sigma-70 family)
VFFIDERAPLLADENRDFVTEIATKHTRRLRRYLAARLRNSTDVADLVQEVFLRLLRVDRHESIRNPEAYVMTVAGHVLHQHALRLATTAQTVDAIEVVVDLQSAIDTDFAAQLDAERRLEQLDVALSKMTPNVHATFVWHRRDGLTLQQIAKLLGVSRPMVKKYLSKALVQCREHFGEEN